MTEASELTSAWLAGHERGREASEAELVVLRERIVELNALVDELRSRLFRVSGSAFIEDEKEGNEK